MAKRKYKAAIFDFDNTLVSSYEIKWKQYKVVAKKFYNVDLNNETISKYWGKPFDLMIAEIFKNVDKSENIKKLLRDTRNDFLKTEYSGSMNVLKKLIENGIRVAILSSTNHQNIVEDLARFNFTVNLLTVIQGADETAVHKPNPEVFIPIFNMFKGLGIERYDIVSVGDSLDDLQASVEANIDFIAVTTGLHSRKDFEEKGAKIIVKDIQEVVKKIIS